MIRYTFATPQQDWFACTLLLPNATHEAVIECLCPTEHLPAGALEFNAIADSIRFIDKTEGCSNNASTLGEQPIFTDPSEI